MEKTQIIIQDLEPLIVDWVIAEGLIIHTQEQAIAQHGKTEEEVGELQEAIAAFERSPLSKLNASEQNQLVEEMKLEAGDVLVTLIIQAAIQRTTLKDVGKLAAHCGPISLPNALNNLSNSIQWNIGFSVAEAIARLAVAVEYAVGLYGLDFEQCLEAAWLKIRDRTGKTGSEEGC
ncbi:MAG: MazG nucleotide pyrophosphohydrolase domain-containing protein [Phormidesmis sp.]